MRDVTLADKVMSEEIFGPVLPVLDYESLSDVYEVVDQYIDAAKGIFEADPGVAVFIYGHTHAPSLRRIGERAVVNTGTWLKKLTPVAPRFGTLPPIYVPSFCLNFFRIHGADGKVVIEYQKIEKKPERELTLVQRLLTPRHGGAPAEPIPERTVVALADRARMVTGNKV
ncbi:MAG: hypothetical protein O7D32_02760 [bacterium]|nr:hypothetical protein [bacterium]